MSVDKKKPWQEKSRIDKARYETERAIFKKTTGRSLSTKRILKHPDAPKRPVSAYFAYSNQRRAYLRRQHRGISNGDLSKMLSKMWKEESLAVKEPYLEKAERLLRQYKLDIASWRKKFASERKTRKKQEVAAFRSALPQDNGQVEESVRSLQNCETGGNLGAMHLQQVGLSGLLAGVYLKCEGHPLFAAGTGPGHTASPPSIVTGPIGRQSLLAIGDAHRHVDNELDWGSISADTYQW